MKQIMTLRKAIDDKHVAIGTESIKYVPDIKKIQVTRARTGADEKEQNFETKELSWRLIELKRGQLALVARTSTGDILTLKGNSGAKDCKKTLNTICAKLWSSSKLDLTAKHISKNDIDDMSNSVKELFKGIWVTTPYEYCKVGQDIKQYVYYLDNRGYYKRFCLNSKVSGAKELRAEIRPIIYLPDDILIDVSTHTLYKDKHEVAKMQLSKIIKRFENGEKNVNSETILELKEILKTM